MSVFGVTLVRIFSHSDLHNSEKTTPYLSVFSPNAGKRGPELLRIRTVFQFHFLLSLKIHHISVITKFLSYWFSALISFKVSKIFRKCFYGKTSGQLLRYIDAKTYLQWYLRVNCHNKCFLVKRGQHLSHDKILLITKRNFFSCSINPFDSTGLFLYSLTQLVLWYLHLV